MKNKVKRKNEELELLENYLENINNLIEQCCMTDAKADNDMEHLIAFAREIKTTISSPKDVNSVWTLLVNAYVSAKIKRRSVLSEVIGIFKPINYFVYLLKQNDDIVYVGKTINVQERLKQHFPNKKFNNISLFVCETVDQQDILENTCIFKYQPCLNKSVNLSMVDNK